MTHLTVAFIVDAETKEDAIGDVRCTIEDGWCDRAGFDYAQIYGDDLEQEDGEPQFPLLLDSEEGQRAIRESLDWQRGEFVRYVTELRTLLAGTEGKSLDEVWKTFTTGRIRYTAHCIGQYSGHQIVLYDSGGCGIADLHEFKAIAGDKPSGKEKRWIVAADVHY